MAHARPLARDRCRSERAALTRPACTPSARPPRRWPTRSSPTPRALRHEPAARSTGPARAAELDAPSRPDRHPDGLGGTEALRLWVEVLAPACISQDHPRALSFVPSAPTEASALFDLVVGASSIYGGSWLEGSGAVHAENQALRWVADLAGLPDGRRRAASCRAARPAT